MDKRILIILGGIVVILAVIAAVLTFTLSGSDDPSYTQLDILGNGTIGENGTLNVKLTNGEGIALKDKEIHVTVKDKNGSVVFEKSAKTYVNGVANVKVENVSPGEYDVNVTFDGDNNFTACSLSEKLTIAQGVVEEDTDSDADTGDDSTSSSQSQSSSSSSYSRSSSSNSYSNNGASSDDQGSPDDHYDEDGNRVEPTYDPDGNPTYDE